MPIAGKNLLPNGDLELEVASAPTNGWRFVGRSRGGDWPYGTLEWVVRGEGDGRCVKLTRPCAEDNTCLITHRPVTLKPNTRYRYGVEMKGTFAPEDMRPCFRFICSSRSRRTFRVLVDAQAKASTGVS